LPSLRPVRRVAELVRPPFPMQTSKPIFGVMSLAMPALSIFGYFVARALPVSNHFSPVDGVFVLLVSILALPVAGAICAVAGIARRERPITFSVAGLFVNVAIPLGCYIIARMGIGSSWIDLSAKLGNNDMA